MGEGIKGDDLGGGVVGCATLRALGGNAAYEGDCCGWASLTQLNNSGIPFAVEIT